MQPTATVAVAMEGLKTVEAPNITKPLLDVCQEGEEVIGKTQR